MSQREDIDVVIAWVDGDDPAHRAKRMAWGGGGAVAQNNDVGGEMRYRATGEIFYCVGSILRFAPWVRKIWIITDNQNPRLDEFVGRNFPDSTTPIEIVDHRTIFEGYEANLPTFNSISIETMMWRIPGLAERFVYLNDDVFLASPIEPSYWFEGESTILHAKRVSTLAGRLLRWIKPKKNGHKTFGHKDAMVNAAQRLGANHFWSFPHTPQALRRSFYERFFGEHPEMLSQNCSHRFRHESQFSFVSLFFIKGGLEGLVKARSAKGSYIFLKPFADKVGYMERKLREADSNPRLLFGCINSLGETTREEQQMFHRWICKRLSIEL
jgi:hypothetical protein